MHKSAIDRLFQSIASTHFSIESLEPQNSDRLDFHEVSVLAIRCALADAFRAGQQDQRDRQALRDKVAEVPAAKFEIGQGVRFGRSRATVRDRVYRQPQLRLKAWEKYPADQPKEWVYFVNGSDREIRESNIKAAE